jgi:hypothetical protein
MDKGQPETSARASEVALPHDVTAPLTQRRQDIGPDRAYRATVDNQKWQT